MTILDIIGMWAGLVTVILFVFSKIKRTQMEETFNTNKGKMTEGQLINSLMYGSYSANRDYGMTHEALVRLGIGNDVFKDKYELEKAIRLN